MIKKYLKIALRYMPEFVCLKIPVSAVQFCVSAPINFYIFKGLVLLSAGLILFFGNNQKANSYHSISMADFLSKKFPFCVIG